MHDHVEYYVKDLLPLLNLLHLAIGSESLSWIRKGWWISICSVGGLDDLSVSHHFFKTVQMPCEMEPLQKLNVISS